MRESMGAAWIMVITMTFITLFSGFLAFSINYSKAFRVKDGVVERIRKFNGLRQTTIDDIDTYLNQIGYKSKGNCKKYFTSEYGSGSNAKVLGVNDRKVEKVTENGLYNYCIIKVTSDKSGSNKSTSSYYKVVVFFALRISNINIGSTFRVTGETSQLHYSTDEFESYYVKN